MRVAVLAEWYPSPADRVLGVWAHRQALAARDAGADVRVVAMRRPLPPLHAVRALARGDGAAARAWGAGVAGHLRSFELDGIAIRAAPFVSLPRPVSYGTWGWWMALPAALALGRLHRAWPFEVLHVHNLVPGAHAALPWLARRRPAGRPALVASTHGPDIIRDIHRSRFSRAAGRAVFDAADLVMANSTWAARRCEEIAGRALPGAVVHLGADVPAEPAPRTGAVLITVAHLVARKRHAAVLHALAALPGGVDWRWVVVGDGPERAALEALARQLGLGARVAFRGQLDHSGALEEVRRADVFVMPGVEEPFGVAYVEAMAAGLPAIGLRGEGGPEDIAAAGEGFVRVEPDNPAELSAVLAALLGDGAERRRLGDAARATVREHFTWEHCGRATVAAYARALEAVDGR